MINFEFRCRWSWTILFIRAYLIVFLLGFLFCFAGFVNPTNAIEEMKVHPAPKKRYISLGYDIDSRIEANGMMGMGSQKKLRRLPHIFSRFLELPFRPDTDVLIEEESDCFRFMVMTEGMDDDVTARAVEIHPGVTKVVIRGSNPQELYMDELEIDMWRLRLPPSASPELASAVHVDGELIVTVPKRVNSDESGDENGEGEEEGSGEGNGDVEGGMGLLVHVQ